MALILFFLEGFISEGRCHSKAQTGCDRLHGWTPMSLLGETRLDANVFLRGHRGSGKGGLGDREGAKLLFCLSSSDLALLVQPSSIRIARMSYSVLTGKLRQGKVGMV